MNDYEKIIQSIEDKVLLLLNRLEEVNSQNQELRNELKSLKDLTHKQNRLIEEKDKDYDALKIAASMLGSDENKRASKLKINALIRDINDCIASLATDN